MERQTRFVLRNRCRVRFGAKSIPAALLAGFLIVGGCGSDPPTRPGSVSPPPPPVQPANQAPVVESVAVSAERAEVDTDVTVTANVRDAETPVDQLRFEWRADIGTFTGEGRSVRWRAAKGVPTPADIVLRVTIRETYGNADASGNRPEHTANGTSPPLRLHDSSKEVADLALDFLRDFSDSSVPPDVAVRHFTDSCAGKKAEREDIEKNREHYQIMQSRYSVQSVSVRDQNTRADVSARCEFTSRVIKCHPEIPNCRVGMTVPVAGICALESRYEQRRWWLCESRFLDPTLTMRGFFFGR